jgi:hypothetical protein
MIDGKARIDECIMTGFISSAVVLSGGRDGSEEHKEREEKTGSG